MKKLILVFMLASGILAAGLFVVVVQAAPPGGFQTTPLVTAGLDGPTSIEIAPDGRVFILERTGKIKIYKMDSY